MIKYTSLILLTIFILDISQSRAIDQHQPFHKSNKQFIYKQNIILKNHLKNLLKKMSLIRKKPVEKLSFPKNNSNTISFKDFFLKH